MNVTIAFGSRVAIPVRALPFVTNLMVTPKDIARGLAEQNEKSEFVAYWADGGDEITPQQWGPICGAIEGLTVNFLNNDDFGKKSRQVETHESVSQLPSGAFVWGDTFKHWLNTECQVKDQVRKEQHTVTTENGDPAALLAAKDPDHSIDPFPNVPPDIQKLVMEGFEAGEYAELIAANRIEVDDFLSLVGLDGLVDDGMYNITQGGVRTSAESWDLYAPGIRLENRKEIKSFIAAAKLDFPCTPQRLVEWANGVNWDFQLPIRFVRAVADAMQQSIKSEQSAGASVDEETLASTDKNTAPKLQIRKVVMLNWLTANGYPPLSLPDWKGNPEGAKSKLKKAMLEQNAKLFTDSSFEKAWEDLGRKREIRYKK